MMKVDIDSIGEGEFVCNNCNCKTFVLHLVTPHIGLYCSNCGKWKGWIPKKVFKNE